MTTVFLGINALFSVLVFPVAEKDCKQCPSALQELENIDDEAEDNGKFLTANFAFAVLFLRDEAKIKVFLCRLIWFCVVTYIIH